VEEIRTFWNQCLGSMELQKQHFVKLNFEDYGYLGFSEGYDYAMISFPCD